MRTLNRLALGLASALTLAAVLAGAARAGDVTYPQLNNQTSVLDTDLLAIWRSPGPLAHLNASVFSSYVVNGLGKSTFLQIGNNLSDLNSIGMARTNLGLGSAALANTGATGTALCQLNSNCTWTGTEAFSAAVTMGSTLGVSGAATLSSTLGVSGLSTLSGGLAVTGAQTISSGTASGGGDYLIMRPTDLGAGKPEIYLHKNAGDNITWAINSYDGTTTGGGNLSLNFANVTQNGQLIVTSGEQITGSGLNVTGGFTLNSGSLSLPAGSISGSEIASGTIASGNIANGAVTTAKLANMAASTLRGNATGSAAAPQDLSVSQVQNLLGLLVAGGGAGGSVTIGGAIINWGTAIGASSGGNGNLESFATQYSSGEVAVCSGVGGACSINSLSNSAISVHNNAGGAQNIYWIVIGT